MIKDYIPEYSEYSNSEKFERKLHSVKRWHGELKMNGSDSESDLEHTESMMKITKEILDNSKAIRDSISNDIYKLILVHDTAEIFAGDPPQELTKEERASHDINERRLGNIFYKNSTEYKDLFNRAFDCDKNDAEALFSKYIDKVQAGTVVLDYFVKNGNPDIVIDNLNMYTIPHTRAVLNKLKNILPTKAFSDLCDFQNKLEIKVNEAKEKLS